MAHWVPKVHPATRAVEADDPLELVATPVQGDPDVMLDCLVHEYALMGWNADQLLNLFRSPGYPLLNQLHAHLGDVEIRRRIESRVGSFGILSVRESFAEPEESEDDEPVLVSLSVDRLMRRE